MKSLRAKILLVLLAIGFIFVIATFNMNWGKVNAEKSVEDLTPLVKKATTNKVTALKYCPALIKKLEKNLKNLNDTESTIKKLKATYAMSECQLAMDDYQHAVLSLSVLSKAEPQVAKWHRLKAQAFFKTGQYNAAMRESRLATQIEPDSFETNLQDARFSRELGLNVRAKKAYESAMSNMPIEKSKATRQEYLDFLSAASSLK